MPNHLPTAYLGNTDIFGNEPETPVLLEVKPSFWKIFTRAGTGELVEIGRTGVSIWDSFQQCVITGVPARGTIDIFPSSQIEVIMLLYPGGISQDSVPPILLFSGQVRKASGEIRKVSNTPVRVVEVRSQLKHFPVETGWYLDICTYPLLRVS